MESAARYVEDVDRDPVVILDGLTKNWRYPGWRVSWTLGPRRVIEALASAGSFLDGGGSRPLQRAAVPLLEPDRPWRRRARRCASAFLAKRELMVRRLRELGLGIDLEPEGTFYVLASLAGLPEPLDDGMAFFGAALRAEGDLRARRVLRRQPRQAARSRRLARFRQHVRLSFGPPMEEVERGLERLERVVAAGQR